MNEPKKLSIEEQVQIIQKVLSDPKFFDDKQLIESGIKKKPKEKDLDFDE